MSPSLKGALFGLSGFGLFSLADATIKHLGSTYSPVQIVAFASLFTLPLILVLWLRAPVALRPVYPSLMALRTAALIANGLMVTYAFTALPLAQAYAILFTLPLILTLLAWPVLGDRLDLIGALAVLVGLAGVIVALNPGRAAFGLGHVAAVGGTVLAAVHYLILRKTGGAEATVPMLLYPVLGQTVAGFLLLPGRYVLMPPSDLGFMLCISLAGFFGTVMMIAAYRTAAPVVVAPTQYSQIAWAALFGALFFAEPMAPHTALGMAIIALAGVMIVVRENRQR